MILATEICHRWFFKILERSRVSEIRDKVFVATHLKSLTNKSKRLFTASCAAVCPSLLFCCVRAASLRHCFRLGQRGKQYSQGALTHMKGFSHRPEQPAMDVIARRSGGRAADARHIWMENNKTKELAAKFSTTFTNPRFTTSQSVTSEASFVSCVCRRPLERKPCGNLPNGNRA